MVFAFVQLISFAGFDLLTPSLIAEGALAVIPMAIALPIGIRAARYFNAKNFDRLVVGMLLVTATILVFRGFQIF